MNDEVKVLINPKTGLVDSPIYPCYKAPTKGLCRIKNKPVIHSDCGEDPKYCRYIKPVNSEKQGK